MNYIINPLTSVIKVSISDQEKVANINNEYKCSLPASTRHQRQQVRPPSASLEPEAHCTDKNMEKPSKVL